MFGFIYSVLQMWHTRDNSTSDNIRIKALKKLKIFFLSLLKLFFPWLSLLRLSFCCCWFCCDPICYGCICCDCLQSTFLCCGPNIDFWEYSYNPEVSIPTKFKFGYPTTHTDIATYRLNSPRGILSKTTNLLPGFSIKKSVKCTIQVIWFIAMCIDW